VTAGAPIGLNCPGCGDLGDQLGTSQAFCWNKACRILMWDPVKTLDEMIDGLRIIDLVAADSAPPGQGRPDPAG